MLKNLKAFNLPEIEEKVLQFWKKSRIFEKSLEKRQGRKKFVFYEGPPTANGQPGIHHMLARAFKDAILRYKTMAGFFVPRRAGWDTHGLPVELQMEKELGLKSKKDIEKFGIAAFNRKCRESVWRYKDEWERFTDRMGFWLDLKDPYITYENNYIEKLWGIIKSFWQNKLFYKGHKIVPWCTRCGTALSSHETALGYEEMTDQAAYVKFEVKSTSQKSKLTTYILSWTTTPWTLPGNVALAVNPKIRYKQVESGREILIFADNPETERRIFGENKPKFQNAKTFKGSELIGKRYEPLFAVKKLAHKNSYRIYTADFVAAEEGTGVVHTAVMYGEDDYELGRKYGLPQHHTVDEEGKFTKDVKGLAGLYVKSKETEERIFRYLKSKKSLFKTEFFTHEYPFCWRCKTPLLYYARDAWFVAVSKLKNKLIVNNKKINWIPESIKYGRFGEWLKEVKDWNFSRERYWGTPIPMWQCEKCDSAKAIGNLKELNQSSFNRNNFFILRHGEAEHNKKDLIASGPETKQRTSRLTSLGVRQVIASAKRLKKRGIDLIYSSPYKRTLETARLAGKELGLKNKILTDRRLREIDGGIFNWKRAAEEKKLFKEPVEEFTKKPPQGEDLSEVKNRMFGFLRELNGKHSGKNILIVGHGDPLWVMEGAARHLSPDEILALDYPQLGEIKEIGFDNFPYDEKGEVDLHRPYADEVFLKCLKCGSRMRRIKEVADAWFDSGAMPFASDVGHQTSNIGNPTSDIRHPDYPADYICEAVDQTRGWFYTLLAVATLLGKKEPPYKNVISLGHILDKNGKKMSKSLGNVVNPLEMMSKYGADAIRFYMYTVNPAGEPKKFDETDLLKTLRRFILILYNSFVFLKTYGSIRNQKSEIRNQKLGILDKWILARLNETILKVTQWMEKYETGEAAKEIESLTDDLSRWYIRRSRRRFQKPENESDLKEASSVLRYALLTISKLIAPFAPFFAEALHKSLSRNESVHLEDWPEAQDELIDQELLKSMAETRRLASSALTRRAEAGIKVRQPLQQLKIQISKSKIQSSKELVDLLKDEVNVKEVIFNPRIKDEMQLDTKMTPALREEGILREFVRLAQDLRQDAGYKPKDKIVLMIEAPNGIKNALEKNRTKLREEVGAGRILFQKSTKFGAEFNLKLDGKPVWLGVRKI